MPYCAGERLLVADRCAASRRVSIVGRSTAPIVTLVGALLTASLAAVAAVAAVEPSTAGATGGLQTVHAVGIATETYVDAHRPTAAWDPTPARPTRTLVTTILYPAQGPSSSTAPVAGASPDRGGAPYPLIVFAHGLGADPRLYTSLLSHWAAAGFVVAAPQFPLTSSETPGGPDAGDVINQPGDVSFVITSVLAASKRPVGLLSGLIKPRAIGAAGHSNGAITTLGLVMNTCCEDRRVKAAVVMAGATEAFPGGHYVPAKAPPLLLVHGTNDSLVPYGGAIAVFNGARGPKGLLTIKRGITAPPRGSRFPQLRRCSGRPQTSSMCTCGATTLRWRPWRRMAAQGSPRSVSTPLPVRGPRSPPFRRPRSICGLR